MPLLIFQQSSIICIGRHVGGHTLALEHGGQNYFLLISCQTFDSYAQMCCKRYHIIISTFSAKIKCKICVQKEVIHNSKNHILVTWPATKLLILRKSRGFEKPNHYYLFKIWPTYRFSKAKSDKFHFQKNDVTWPLSANPLLVKSDRLRQGT